jgi:hypothetical protein
MPTTKRCRIALSTAAVTASVSCRIKALAIIGIVAVGVRFIVRASPARGSSGQSNEQVGLD